MAKFFQIGCFSAAVAVAIGAFGAHGLKGLLEANQSSSTFRTAVLYHFLHTFLILLMSISPYHSVGSKTIVSVSAIVGIVLFSGSLYLLSTLQWKWLVPITPIGGLFFLFCWVWAALTIKI